MKALGLVLSAAIFCATQVDAATLRVTAEVGSLDLTLQRLEVLYVISDPYGPSLGYVDPSSDEYAEIVAEFHPLASMKVGDVAVLDFTFPDELPINSGTNDFEVNCIAGAACQSNGSILDIMDASESTALDLNFSQSTGDWAINVYTAGGYWARSDYSFLGNTSGFGVGLVSGGADGACCGTSIEREGKVYFWVEPQVKIGFSNVTIEGLPSPVPLPASILLLGSPAALLMGLNLRRRKEAAAPSCRSLVKRQCP